MCGIVDVCTTPCIIYNFQTLMKVLFSVHQSVRALDVNINRHKPPVDMCRYLNLDINIIVNTRISRRVTIVTQCHNCDGLCHNCDILFVKMLELGSEIIPKN